MKNGAKKGDVLALILPNVPEFVFVFTGAPLAGIVVTTISPSMKAYEIGNQLASSGANWVVTDMKAYPEVTAALKKLEGDRTIGGQGRIRLVIDLKPGEYCPPDTIPLSSMMSTEDDGDITVPEVQVKWQEEVVVIPYSSGTTGPPKGVELTHKYVKL